MSVSKVFQERGIPFIEGWGLTEAAPSCTLTKPSLNRVAGNVGFAIPGVEIKLAPDHEILVRGPNIMKGYFKSPEATNRVIDEEGWLHTGDVGGIDFQGLQISGRKDRIFKLSNGKKISPQILEERIKSVCPYAKHVYVFGKGLQAPCVLIFPDFTLILRSDLEKSIHLFSSALKQANCLADAKYEKIAKALLLKVELQFEKDELTPSLKLKFNTLEEKYKVYMNSLISGDGLLQDALKIFV